MEVEWKGEKGSVNEVGYNKADPEHVLVKIDPQYFRPTEVELLLGNPAKAKKHIGWEPEVSFDDLVKEMVEADIALVEKGDLTS
ncbi:gdp-mannose -dehydratase [Nannochloropsis gaditana]|uniref:GDP-mannose 4,6-dehydratase n=1 Tax=Nannochloropsis gaditana TaxID=72520 RepID=W7U030_9STRA|nr:gdp-mannose -dehydratase [Nannochloropsis gaditana]